VLAGDNRAMRVTTRATHGATSVRSNAPSPFPAGGGLPARIVDFLDAGALSPG